MADQSLPYARTRVHPTFAGLKTWKVEWDDKSASGPCPRCSHPVNLTWKTRLVEMGVEAGAPPAVSRKVVCGCNKTHTGEEATETGCGAFWFATFHADPVQPQNQQVTPQSDAKIVAAAEAFEKATQDEETRLRA